MSGLSIPQGEGVAAGQGKDAAVRSFPLRGDLSEGLGGGKGFPSCILRRRDGDAEGCLEELGCRGWLEAGMCRGGSGMGESPPRVLYRRQHGGSCLCRSPRPCRLQSHPSARPGARRCSRSWGHSHYPQSPLTPLSPPRWAATAPCASPEGHRGGGRAGGRGPGAAQAPPSQRVPGWRA